MLMFIQLFIVLICYLIMSKGGVASWLAALKPPGSGSKWWQLLERRYSGFTLAQWQKVERHCTYLSTIIGCDDTNPPSTSSGSTVELAVWVNFWSGTAEAVECSAVGNWVSLLQIWRFFLAFCRCQYVFDVHINTAGVGALPEGFHLTQQGTKV